MMPASRNTLFSLMLTVAMVACPYFCLGSAVSASDRDAAVSSMCLCGCQSSGRPECPSEDRSAGDEADCLCHGAVVGACRPAATAHATWDDPNIDGVIVGETPVLATSPPESHRPLFDVDSAYESGRRICSAISIWRL